MSNRKVQLCYSDDGGQTWSNWRERSLGEVGEYEKRVRFHRLGSFRNRVWRFRVSSPIQRDVITAVVLLSATSG